MGHLLAAGHAACCTPQCQAPVCPATADDASLSKPIGCVNGLRFGKRILDSVPAEERLMRGVPKNVSKVIIRQDRKSVV